MAKSGKFDAVVCIGVVVSAVTSYNNSMYQMVCHWQLAGSSSVYSPSMKQAHSTLALDGWLCLNTWLYTLFLTQAVAQAISRILVAASCIHCCGLLHTYILLTS
jgi:hypothetical protein